MRTGLTAWAHLPLYLKREELPLCRSPLSPLYSEGTHTPATPAQGLTTSGLHGHTRDMCTDTHTHTNKDALVTSRSQKMIEHGTCHLSMAAGYIHVCIHRKERHAFFFQTKTL